MGYSRLGWSKLLSINDSKEEKHYIHKTTYYCGIYIYIYEYIHMYFLTFLTHGLS